ncbi:MAG: hypothetical protein K2Y56_24060 [Methylobacterium sp.]|uniref:hypothetical protein n=1 Tax=Methylobacterium sp. TaxID=409 RepID=UPI0025D08087|nr:hypothetical protein [Methylobacterium sp.]MBX9934553.1 hypothetical protein [Methylobacterium sp.]
MSVKILQAGEDASPSSGLPAPPAAAPTPSETMVRAAQSVGTCKCSSGRTYVFRKLAAIDRMLIAKALGGDLMFNGVYASYAFVACSVSEINGEKVAMPVSTRQVEAQVYRIGEDWDELNAAMRDTFNPPSDDPDDDGDE